MDDTHRMLGALIGAGAAARLLDPVDNGVTDAQIVEWRRKNAELLARLDSARARSGPVIDLFAGLISQAIQAAEESGLDSDDLFTVLEVFVAANEGSK